MHKIAIKEKQTMAQTTTWKINDMKRATDTGAVDTVYWECRVQDDTYTECQAIEGGKLRLTPDPDAADFIPYADLTEATVLGWVYNSLIEGDETANEARLVLKLIVKERLPHKLLVKQPKHLGCLGN